MERIDVSDSYKAVKILSENGVYAEEGTDCVYVYMDQVDFAESLLNSYGISTMVL